MGQIDDIQVLPDDLTTYENRMNQAINDFCMMNGIQSMKEEPQNVYMACLMFVNRQVFRAKMGLQNNQKSVLDYSDVDILTGVAEWYIFTSAMYNKTVSVNDYCRLIGIQYETFRRWGNDSSDNILSQRRYAIFKAITNTREETLANLLQTAKSPVGILGILNRQFNWNLPGVSREESKPRLSRSDMLQGLDALPVKQGPAAGGAVESSQIPQLPETDNE